MPRKIKKSPDKKAKAEKALKNIQPLAGKPLTTQPAVSVIIPMYNVEEYIAEALNSILWQTFADFEIIVVDDCSTDKSCEIVESYIPKFGGRLNLIRLETNSGYGSIPRNKGLEVARGEYVFFMDSDDVISENALEKLYTDAKKTDADVVYCKHHLESEGNGEELVKNAELKGDQSDKNIDLVTDDTEMRINAWQEEEFAPAPWKKFVKRDLLIENEIKFLPIMQEDSVWTFELICLAKKIIMVPYFCYIFRRRPDSVREIGHSDEFTAQAVRQKFERIVIGFKHIDEVMSKVEFFQNNLEWRYKVLDFIFKQNMKWFMGYYEEYPARLVYRRLKDAFKKETGDFDVLIAYLLSSQMKLISTLEDLNNQIESSRNSQAKTPENLNSNIQNSLNSFIDSINKRNNNVESNQNSQVKTPEKLNSDIQNSINSFMERLNKFNNQN